MAIEINIDGTKELSKALVEILSPATELLGTIGDKARIYRQLSLLRSLKRAKEIADTEGLALKEPALKFLVPLLEDCSLEDPDDSTLIDMWARLLVSESRTHKSEHHLFIRVLRELTGEEAKLLQYICSPEEHTHCEARPHFEDIETDWRDSYVYIKIRDVINSLGGMSVIEEMNLFDLIHKNFLSIAETEGAIVYFFDIGSGIPNQYPIDDVYSPPRSAIDDDFDQSSIAVLKDRRLGWLYQPSAFLC
ncbi:DUF4393 domain-containing protein [Luteimonas gilva]|uniref:DUF4393 domain-containing protein n=1 Tax=Luteimonas gilva TaxID=2572684 RepID=A0A4U5JMB1_9GAMM|nr:Abi-alpha family protein [Luteimonas gilva]TKR30684.1 DUF4393 domain-containing protein [Luteimonas gilva]